MLASSLASLVAVSSGHLSLLLLLTKATLILVAALGITMAMQRTSAGARHLVWLVTLGTLLVMPALTAWGPLPLRVLPAAPAPTASVPVAPARFPTTDPERSVIPEASNTTPAPVAAPPVSSPATDAATASGPSGLALALAIWAAVVGAIAISLVWSALAVRRIVSRAAPLDAPEWMTPLWEVSDRFGLQDAPRLLRSQDAKMPFACGLLAPTIVLPAECDGWSPDRRHAVLLHELAHVRRHDLLGHTLGRLVCAVYWFHPLVWTAARQLRSESERACDDLALSCGTRATDYAEHLLDIVTSVRRDATPSVALAMARRKEFEGRMLAILDPQLKRSAPSRRQTASLLASLAMFAVLVGAAAPVPRTTPAAASVGTRDTATTWLAVPRAADTAVGFERDSRIHGIETHTATSQSRTSSQSTMTGTQTMTREGPSLPLAEDITASVRAEARATAVATATAMAPSVSVSVLRSLIQGGAGQQKSDDRPILLARVLRSDTSAALRRVAAWGLSEYTEAPVATEALVNAVRRDANVAVREMAAWALHETEEGTPGVMDALTAALRDSDAKVRATAAWALGNVGDHAAIDALVAALGDANTDVRTRALWAIGEIEPKQAPRQVIALLNDKDARVRELAAWVLYQVEDPSAAPALQAALKTETDKDLQMAYIHALAAMGERSVDAIRGLLESNDQRVKTMAVKALAGGHAAGPWPWPWPEPRPYP